jgi:transcriptional regulator
MYIPRFNQLTNRELLLEAMRAFSFAVLYCPGEGGSPTATHLPLVIAEEGEHGLIEGHFARANPHWQTLAGREVLVVFSGPHGYVSPSLYANPQSVPTWNYIAVHAYGVLELVEDEAGKDELVKKLIAVHEPGYAEQWRSLPEHYQSGMLKGIVGFRIPIARIEGKFKLSQNRPEEDRQSVQAAHAQGSPEERALALWMERLKRMGIAPDGNERATAR